MARLSDRERIQIHWDRLFQIAEEGFQARGRGVVFVREWSGEFTYLTAVEARESLSEPNLLKSLEFYDPQEQVIIVVHHGIRNGEEVLARYELRKDSSNQPATDEPPESQQAPENQEAH